MRIMGIAKKATSDREYLRKEMNLLPPDIKIEKIRRLKRVSYGLLSLLIIAAIVVGNLWLNKTIEDRLSEKASIESKIKSLSNLESDQELFLAIDGRIESKSRAIKSFELISPKVIPVLNSLENNLPAGISLISASMSGTNLSLYGNADSQQTVAEYLHNLKSEDLYSSVVVESVSGLEDGEDENLSSMIAFYMTCTFDSEGVDENGSI